MGLGDWYAVRATGPRRGRPPRAAGPVTESVHDKDDGAGEEGRDRGQDGRPARWHPATRQAGHPARRLEPLVVGPFHNQAVAGGRVEAGSPPWGSRVPRRDRPDRAGEGKARRRALRRQADRPRGGEAPLRRLETHFPRHRVETRLPPRRGEAGVPSRHRGPADGRTGGRVPSGAQDLGPTRGCSGCRVQATARQATARQTRPRPALGQVRVSGPQHGPATRLREAGGVGSRLCSAHLGGDGQPREGRRDG